MAKNTSFLLGDYYDALIEKSIKSGKYKNASEVLREALRLFEQEQEKTWLMNEIRLGKESGEPVAFDYDKILKEAKAEYEQEI